MKTPVETNLYRAKAILPVGNIWRSEWTEKDKAEGLAKWYCQTWAEHGVKAKSAVFYRDGNLVSEHSNDL